MSGDVLLQVCLGHISENKHGRLFMFWEYNYIYKVTHSACLKMTGSVTVNLKILSCP